MRSVLRLVTPPADRAVSLNEARRHLRIEDTDQDDLIAAYIEAAEQSLSYIGRALKPATYALDIYGIGSRYIDLLDIYGIGSRYINLPMPPLRAISSVSTVGSTGTLSVLDPSAYSVMTAAGGQTLVVLASTPAFTYGSIWATIQYTAGYDVVPSALRAAILLIVGTLYENRSGASPVSMTKLPYGIDSLVGPFRELTM
jgi:uncharacterized phiE125 gp8 family phage protein